MKTMKLYLSSYRIPDVDRLAQLVGKPADEVSIALIPNAGDYYAPRAKAYKINDILTYHRSKGLVRTDVVDLINHRNPMLLKQELAAYDVMWASGGNTFCLRQEMKRSGLENFISELLDDGIVYGGDSAGAVVVGTSLRGIESVDIPDFTEEPLYDGLGLLESVIIPHVGNEYFEEANQHTRDQHKGQDLIELSDAEALIVDGEAHDIVTTDAPEI